MRKTPKVALAIRYLPHQRRIIQGIIKYGHAHGEWNVYTRDGIPLIDIEHLRNWEGDGVIAEVREKGELYHTLLERGIPTVNISGIPGHVDLPLVISDNHAIGRQGAKHFLNRAFRHFGYCARVKGVQYSISRAEGFVEVIEKAGFDCSTYTYEPPEKRLGDLEAETGLSDGQQHLSDWIASLPQPIGILCANDKFGQQVVQECKRLGIYVPDRVAVLGVDDDALLCQIPSPSLSSIPQALERIGYEAARLLDDLMEGKSAPNAPLLIAPEPVVVRQSTDVLATEDKEIVSAIRWIRKSADRPINVEDILERIGISRRTLERRFREVLGRSPSAEITRIHIERAKTLLANTDMPLAQVAANAGFSSNKYLMTVFRKTTGMTPGKYRDKSRSA